MEQLRRDLLKFDGRDTGLLENIHAHFSVRRGYTSQLIALVGEEEAHVSRAATWLLRHHIENGSETDEKTASDLTDRLESVTDWQASLHLLQTVRLLDIAAEHAGAWESFAQSFLNHKRPFLRAWALDALCALAKQHENLRPEALVALDAAEQDEAASVRARARSLRKGN